jgi:SAM-dependent methyltransferase
VTSSHFHAALLPLLRCLQCGGTFSQGSSNSSLSLICVSCGGEVPLLEGIPRFATVPADPVARSTQESFGYEWTAFNDWRPSGAANFAQYFGDLDPAALQGWAVLDAGCGMGRHARQVGDHAGFVVAMDFSRAIDQAARNVASLPNVACVQGDVFRPPFAEGSFDFVYSLGVLHHVDDTALAIRRLTSKLKPGGRFRLYLYWKRHGLSGALLRVVGLARRITTRLPYGVLRAMCWLLSAILFAVVILPYRALLRLGVRRHASWPLFVYAGYPFRVLYNDQFDRFSAPLEKRYDAEEVRSLLRAAGLEQVRVWPSFGWIGEGVRPSS